MSKIPKAKKNQMILVVMGAVVVMAGIWYSVIQTQDAGLAKVQKKTSDIRDKISKAESLLKKAEQIQAELQGKQKELTKIENGMASGDLYLWMINTMNDFNSARQVTVADFARETLGDVGVLAKFPYKAATFPIRGTGYFHDIGRFVADFENAFPYVRVQNLELNPIGKISNSPDAEKLNFRLEVVALVKPSENNLSTTR